MLETEKRFRCSEGPPRLTSSGYLFMQPTPVQHNLPSLLSLVWEEMSNGDLLHVHRMFPSFLVAKHPSDEPRQAFHVQ